MRHPLFAVVLLTTVMGFSVAQAQSSLSRGDVLGIEGTWALDSDPSEARPSERRVITVGPDRLTVVIHRASVAPVTLIYKFDGSDSESPFGQGTATARLRQDDGRLLTITVFTVNDAPVTVNEFLRVNAEQTELTVETMLRVEHGYQGVRPTLESKAPNVGTAVRVFRRQ
jgi:hypothetical protein